jgi:hypothetical protein
MKGGKGKIEPRWTKGQSGNSKGRPPKLISGLITDLKHKGYERASVTNVIEVIELLINLPEDEIKNIIKDDKQPLSVRIVGKQLLSPKGFEAIETVLSRAQGKPKQQMDIQQTNTQPVEVRVKITKDDLTSDPIE